MKKLATILGGLICLSVMNKPSRNRNPQTVNNYFIKSGGCSGGCGGHCSCGKH